jgi:transketolase
MSVPAVHPDDYTFTPGKAVVLREGTDITIAANGVVLHRALTAADQLAEQGIQARVLSIASVKPIDQDAITTAARETGAILTVEEGLTTAGLGSAIAEIITQNGTPVPMKILGLPDTYAPTGTTAWILDHYGISPDGITQAATELLSRGARQASPVAAG